MRTGPGPPSGAAHATTVASVGPYVFQTSRPSVASRWPSSGGQASPPKMSSRTFSSDSAGHSAASVGTVDTIVTPCVVSHGPRSMPLRTRLRGAGTRHAPWRHASHISSQLASNATERPASTRSPGPIGSCWRKRRASASTKAAADRCETATPLGVPVDPDVKMIHASSSGAGGATSGSAEVEACAAAAGRMQRASAAAASASPAAPVPAARGVNSPVPVTTPATRASPNTSRARSSGSSASTGT